MMVWVRGFFVCLFGFLYLKRKSFRSGKYIFNLKKRGFQSQQLVLYGAVFCQATGCLFLHVRAFTSTQATTENTLLHLPNPLPVSKQNTTSTKHRLRAALRRESYSNLVFSPDPRVLSQVRSPVICM